MLRKVRDPLTPPTLQACCALLLRTEPRALVVSYEKPLRRGGNRPHSILLHLYLEALKGSLPYLIVVHITIGGGILDLADGIV